MSLLEGATSTGLTLPSGISYQDWTEVGNVLRSMTEGSPWWLGDWWCCGERTYGESASQAAPTGYAVKSLQNSAYVASRVDPSRRRATLSFSHHSAVAALDAEEQDRLLDDAELHGWSVHRLRQQVQVEREQASEPALAKSTAADPLRTAVATLEHDVQLLARCDLTHVSADTAAEIIARLEAVVAGVNRKTTELQEAPCAT